MENNKDDYEELIKELYEYAAFLMIREKKDTYQTIDILIAQGVDEKSASIIVTNVKQQIDKIKRDKANNNILYGALWLLGGVFLLL